MRRKSAFSFPKPQSFAVYPGFLQQLGRKRFPAWCLAEQQALPSLPCHKRKGGACSHLYIFFLSLAVPEKKLFPCSILTGSCFYFSPTIHPFFLLLPFPYPSHNTLLLHFFPPSVLLFCTREKERMEGEKEVRWTKGRGKESPSNFCRDPFFPLLPPPPLPPHALLLPFSSPRSPHVPPLRSPGRQTMMMIKSSKMEWGERKGRKTRKEEEGLREGRSLLGQGEDPRRDLDRQCTYLRGVVYRRGKGEESVSRMGEV